MPSWRSSAAAITCSGSPCSARPPRDDFDPQRSDLDFLVDFESLTPGEHADAYFGLIEGLQSLFDRSIDLVESSMLRNPYRRQEIETTRVLLHAAA